MFFGTSAVAVCVELSAQEVALETFLLQCQVWVAWEKVAFA